MNQLKNPLTLNEQIDLLKARGLVIEDKSRARDVLSKTSYYRIISAYSLGLYVSGTEKSKAPQYLPGISLDQLYDIYEFDTKLRHIAYELVEVFELRFRTVLSYYLANRFCATAYLRPELFRDKEYHDEFLADLEREKEAQHRSPIVQHHNKTYNGTLPVWAMVEVVSFGTLSKLYKNLLPEHQKRIANVFGTKPVFLCSWLNSFVFVRNICAHYGRLYNRNLLARPVIPKAFPRLDDYKVFSVIYILFKYIDDPLIKLSLYYRLKNALVTHTFVEHTKLGIPENWEQIVRDEIGLSKEDIAGTSSDA